ncbi:MAG: cytidylate kinase-like family protein [Nitrospirae bacterium]|nr:MAG: cytidylate kinase-like family protein [Nitrospirota bacterium]
MPIVTISSASYEQRKQIAEALAERLGCRCVARSVLLEASEEFNIPEVKLISALRDAPSILDKITYGRERYLAYIRLKILEAVREGDAIYHGLAGHFFFQGVPHVLKVRYIANAERRIQEVMQREGVSEAEARARIADDDEARRKWAKHIHGTDPFHARLYDLVIHGDTIPPEGAVELIAFVAQRPCFQTTEETTAMLEELVRCARIEALLVKDYPRAKCRMVDGVAHITIHESPSQAKRVEETLRSDPELSRSIDSFVVHAEPVN